MAIIKYVSLKWNHATTRFVYSLYKSSPESILQVTVTRAVARFSIVEAVGGKTLKKSILDQITKGKKSVEGKGVLPRLP